MIRHLLTGLLALHLGCSDDGEADDDGQRGGNGGEGSGAAGASGGASANGGAGGSATGSGGAGGGITDRCPEVCAKLDTVFASFGCTVEECNCKAACADVFEESIDCLAAGADCSCSGNELECDDTCQAETNAANDCYQAN